MATTAITNPAYRQTARVRATVHQAQLHWLVRWAFYAFMFSLPFDVVVPTWFPLWLQGHLSVSRIVGYVLVLCFIVDPRTRPWRLSAAFGFFAVYTLVSMFYGVVSSLAQAFTSLQVLALYFICYNLFATTRVVRGALLSFVLSCSMVSGLASLGLTVVPESVEVMGGRVAAFGTNPNLYAKTLVLGTVCALGMAFIRRDKRPLPAFVFWLLAIVLVIGIAQTGSRGMSLALVVGLVALALRKGRLSARARGVALATVALVLTGWLFMKSDVLLTRWTETLETGAISHREMLARISWEMWLEKPLCGWGPAALTELSDRSGAPDPVRATHNRPLTLLTQMGLLGTVPFYCGYVLVVLSAWRARRGTENILPFALFMAVSVFDVASGGIPSKLEWVIFAYMSAVGQLAAGARSYRSVVAAATIQHPLLRRYAR